MNVLIAIRRVIVGVLFEETIIQQPTRHTEVRLQPVHIRVTRY